MKRVILLLSAIILVASSSLNVSAQDQSFKVDTILKTDFRSQTIKNGSLPRSLCVYKEQYHPCFYVGDGVEGVVAWQNDDKPQNNCFLWYMSDQGPDDCGMSVGIYHSHIYYGLTDSLFLEKGQYKLNFMSTGIGGENQVTVYMYPHSFASPYEVKDKKNSSKTLLGQYQPSTFLKSEYVENNENAEWPVIADRYSYILDIKADDYYVLEWTGSSSALISNFTITTFDPTLTPQEPESDSIIFADYYPDGFIPDFAMPDAALFYDFDGNGKKGTVISTLTGDSRDALSILYKIGSFDTYFSSSVYHSDARENRIIPVFIEDVNHDGFLDFGSESNSYMSIGSEYSPMKDAIIIPNGDLNNDGRIDYLRRTSWGYNIFYQQPDGSFKGENMQIMTQEEYDSHFDPDKWTSTESNSQPTGLSVRQYSTPAQFSGAVLAKSLMRANPRASEDGAITADIGDMFTASANLSTNVNAPTKAIDLNGDNLVDLINENKGIIYFNMGDAKWIKCDIGGAVYVADLNSDGIQDYILPGDNLYSIIYRGNGEYEKQLLYSNISVDRELYCYDFDHDGDVDILVTFSAPDNSTGYAYTMFFSNDGNGNFTQEDEQDYGDMKLCFSNCQDVDGDGWMDMLGFNYCDHFYDYYGKVQTQKIKADVYLLKGKPGLEFSEPILLYETLHLFGMKYVNYHEPKINAEDIDNDGKIEVWVSGETYDRYPNVFGSGVCHSESYVYVNSLAKENTRPLPPSKPNLTYDNGVLLVNWGNGSDAETQTIDLTYALKIGTTPGGDDILSAHANADGMRRNFLDGNMNKKHSYTIDLSSYNPATIYVSVQSIDAQHCGSEWSEAAQLDHTALPVSFVTVKKTVNLNEWLEVSYTPLPRSYSHSWIIEDGRIVKSDSSCSLIEFVLPGEKVITHTLSGNNGVTASFSSVVTVLPVKVDTLIIGYYYDENGQVSDSEKEYNTIIKKDKSWADYNLDGYLDYANLSGEYVIKRGKGNHSYEKAPGVWNTGLQMSGAKWLDWDHDGFLDCTYYFYDYPYGDNSLTCYYLLHNGRNNLTQKKEDKGLYFLFFDRIRKSNTYFMNFEDSVKNDLKSKYGKEDDGYFGLWNGKWNFTLDKPDINHCGYPSDIIQYVHTMGGGLYVYDNYIISRRNNGELFATEVVVNNETERVPLYGIQYNIDMDHNGFVDVITYYKDELSSKSKGLSVYFNFGNGVFEKVNIPFEIELNDAALIHSYNYNEDDCKIADFNNDGYYDIFAVKRDAVPYIMYNHGNQYYSKPEVLPLGDLKEFYGKYYYYLADINNDGYIDIISRQMDATGNENLYAHFMGANGVESQGFCLVPSYSKGIYYSYGDLYPSDGGQWVVPVITREYSYDATSSREYNYKYVIFDISPENEKPQAPTGVRAVKTEDGLLIEWNDAEDDHTPAVQMRYNISVKHKGQTGAGSYVISPQNGGNANAAFLPEYDYICATRYLVPNSVLPVGEYEIQVQAIDLCNEMGAFSDVLDIYYERPVIDAPTLANADRNIEVRYMGEPSTGTPEWDFDGAESVSGSGFGPYSVAWSDAGIKTISLTLDGKTHTHMLYVDKNTAQVKLPEYLILGTTFNVDIPDDMTASWSVLYFTSGGWNEYSVNKDGINGLQFVLSMKIDGNKITVGKTIRENHDPIKLRLVLTNKNGSTKAFEQNLNFISQDMCPMIYSVSPDADGHNYISLANFWTVGGENLFPKVRIMKETNVRNKFVELAEIDQSENMGYTDMSSNANIKADRYAVIGVMANGYQSPISEIHQSVHAVINRGMTDNVWNLMWSQYQGADVATYNILRGSSPADLQQIASVSGSFNTYTDFVPSNEAQYYAIEYVFDDGSDDGPEYSSASRGPLRGSSSSGRSNVVVASSARSAIYADRMSILSANGLYELTAEKTSLFLYAEIFPVEATYKNVRWEITSGEKLASIDNSGLLTANKTGTSGTVTVKATAVDGSGVSATRTITVEAIAGEKFQVLFVDMDGTVLKTEYVEYGGSVTPPEPLEHYGYEFSHWDGDYSNITDDIIINAVYTDADAVESISVDKKAGKTFKTIKDGQFIIVLPDGRMYNSAGIKVN